MTTAMFDILRRLQQHDITLVMDTGQEVAGRIVSIEEDMIEIRCPEHVHFVNPERVVEFFYFHGGATNGSSNN